MTSPGERPPPARSALRRLSNQPSPPNPTALHAPEPSQLAASSGGPIHALVMTAVVLYVLLATFSTQFGVLEPGLDQSWMFGLNWLATSEYIFGQDVVFTYGPLGFLTQPRAIGNNLLWGALFAASVQVILGLSLVLLVTKNRNRKAFLVFVAGFLMAGLFGLWQEYYFRAVLVLALLASIVESRLAPLVGMLAGALAAMLVLVKFSIALSVASILPLWILLVVRQRDKRGWLRAFGPVGVTFVAVFLLCVRVLFHGVGAFVSWVLLSFEIASGYGSAMSTGGPAWEAMMATGLLFASAALIFVIKSPARTPLIVCFPSLVMAFKHGFVGGTSMATGYFTFLLAVCSLLFLYTESARETLITACFYIIIACVTLVKGVFFVASPALTLERIASYVTLRSSFADLSRAWNHEATAKELTEEGHRRLAEEVLPTKWASEMKRAKNGVDVYPWELTYLAANKVKWRPSLVLHQYSTYTSKLDEASAGLLMSAKAPGVLLVQLTGLFQRHPLLDSPTVFRTILAAYEPVYADPMRDLILLRRRSGGVVPVQKLVPISSSASTFDKWNDVPVGSRRLYAKIQIRRNVMGLLRKYLWKTPAVFLRLRYASGKTSEYRILPDTVQNGILMNFPSATVLDLNDLMQGSAFDRVVRFQISGEWATSFKEDFEITWVTDEIEVKNHAEVKTSTAPEIVASAPSAATKQTDEVEVRARYGGGYRNLRFVQALVGTSLNGSGACYISYEVQQNTVWLIADSGSGAAGQGAPGALEILENSQCMVSLRDTWIEAKDEQIALHIPVASKLPSSTRLSIFATAIANDENKSPWTQLGRWRPGSALSNPWIFPEAPPSLYVNSVRGPGPREFLFNIRVSDLNGRDDIRSAELIVNDLPSGRRGCYLRYDVAARALILMDDGGINAAGYLQPGSGSTVANSYCRASTGTAPLREGPRDVNVSVSVSLTPKMEAKRVVFGSASDRSGLQLSWKAYQALPPMP